MGEYTNSLIGKHRKPGARIMSGHDNCEQMRELKELQRSLAQRILRHQRGVQPGRANETV